MNAFVHEWFAAHAAARGDAVAIDAGSLTLTYADLDRASTRLARSLATRVPPGTLVGVFTDDPIEIVTAVLAILQAGAAFVPMEPSSGIGRLALLSREIDLTWWIAAPSLVEKLEAVAVQAKRRFNLLSIDADAGHEAAGEDGPRVDIRRPPDDLCYVYFTSGSTGQPKGIAGRLKAIDHFIRWEMRAIGALADLRVSQLTSPVFDAYLRDVFLPLCAGGVLCVPPDPGVRGDASRLIAWLRDSRVNVVHCVPSLLRSLLRVSEAQAGLPALRHVLTSGEPLLPVDVRAWMSRYGTHARLTNLYGPSETTMVKFAYEVKPEDAERTMIPIGRPIDGTRAIVLNARGQVCLPGVTGEIYIRTPYRSLGYYGRPDLTAEVFVPNPFGSDPTDLIYRTGDLGRVLEDGTYEFLGRRDRQVKIRGVRVELAEIENVIRREPRVQDCCVIDRELPDGSKSLCACVVLRDGLTRHALSAQLRDLLPESMMPVFVELSALPRTPSGKVDRQALEALAIGAGPLDDDGWTPRTPVEDLVAMEWARALGLDRVPLHHDFFRDLGGHSLLATQVLQRLQPLFDVPLQLRWLFDAPTVATFSASIDRALTEAAGTSEPEPVLARAARDGLLPLSFGQERLWMVDQVIGTRAYHVPLALALGGPLNASALRAAVTGLATRHEILRTTIDVVDGRPVQRIAPPAAVSLPCVDLSGIDVDSARRMRVQRGVVRQLERAAFDLRAGPLWRVALIRCEPTRHVLSCTLHHIAADGWSIGVLLRDLSALYEAACTSEPARVPDLSVQYADYALWERRALSGARLQAQLDYWTRQLHDVAPLALPTDRPRRSTPSGEGAVAWRKWPPALTARVHEYGRANGATLFMVLMAGWQALLARYARQRDVAVGVPVAQRPRPELEPLVGFFLNTIVLRTQVRGGESWRALTAHVRAQALAAYAHQLVPFEQVIAALQPERQLGRTPLFQVLFVLQNLPTPGEQPAALRLDVLESRSTGAKFDLELAVKSRGDDLMCRLEYAVDLFDRERIERMLGHLEMLMASALDAPEAPLDELSCLTPAERAQIVRGWNATAVDWPADDAVAWMEAQATRTPDAVAVQAEAVNGHEAWSHAHLHAEANRIARRLRRLRVGPESRVGIWMSRSPLMVAGVLGTLKAGAAYVPLDPRYPAARLASQVADADVAVVLTDSLSRAAIPAGPYSVERLDAPDAAWRRERPTSLASGRGRSPIVDPAQLAYVIYTSGSTGRPKGAMNTHAGLVNRLRWMQALYGVTAGDRVLQKTSISFDVSVWELLLPLAAGATMMLARPDGQQDPSYLARMIAQSGVTVAHFVPSMLEAFAAADGLASCASLRLLVSSGEALPRRLAAQVRAEWPGRLENLYGPTEAAVDVTAHRVDADDAGAVVPIGRPVANTHIHLVDRAGQLVPIGVDGELCIGGVQVGRGYWAQPALTAERFTPDPFAETPGARLYRSGDLARARPAGAIEYIGRIDHQVKLRGNRIELGEIEAVLRQRPEVRDAVVVLRESSTGERRLVAFVVPRGAGNGPVRTDTIQQGLRQQLPDYMVPAAIVSIDALPLTPSGKIDRQHLPVESMERPALAVSYAAPRTEIEHTLARLWADVLRRPQIGLHDNFFALGGDSILGLQIVARARESGLHLLPQQVFQYQTIAELALAAESASPQVPTASRAEAPVADAPLTPIQRWFFELEPDVPDHFNQAVLLAGGPDLPAQVWEASINALVARHEALRLRVSRTDAGEWRQRCAAVETHRVFMQVDLAGTGSASLRWVTRIASRVQRSLNLADGPIVRVVAFRGPARDTDRILIVVHHAAIDGVSWRTLVDELSRTTAPRPSSFLRWASRLASRATSLAPEVRAYWAGAAARGRDLHIPRDHDPAFNRIRSQRSHSVTFSAAETQQFLQQPPRAYRMQAHEVLIAAAASALSAWSGLSDAWIALESHGRDVLDDAEDVSRTVGCFTSLFPVCVNVPDGSPDQVLIAVKERLRRVPRSGLDYGLWRYGVAGADAHDMPDVLVNYFGQFDQVLDAGGWRLANESAGHSRHPAGRRPFLLEINGGVIAGQLQVTVSYSLDCHRSETIAAFVDLFAARVRALVEHCRTTPWTRTTPIDVPMADLAQRELDALAETGGEIEDVYPLSPMQEGLLFHSVFEPDREVYFQQFRVTMEGDLDLEALRQAWTQVITRHAVLRTAFVWEERPRPLQVVYANVPLAAAQHDLRDLDADVRAARVREFLEADRARGFRLDRVPLLRLAFLRLAERRWEMVWSYHHILIDGWCVPLVFKEVATAYEARRVGREAVLPPVARFRTYIEWLRQQDTAQAKAYWRGVLDGVDEPVTILPSPRTGDDESAKSTDYDHRSRVVPSPTVAAVHDRARRAHLTMNTVVQGAWALLLARHAGVADVIFGATSSGRPTTLPGIEAMIGLFINTLPVRVSAPSRAQTGPWLQALQSAQAEARQFEYTPLADIQAWSGIPHGLPLFESILAFENYPVDDELVRGQASFGIAKAQVFEKTNYPITVQVSPASGLSLRMLFDGRRLEGATAERMLAQFERLLAALASAGAETRLGDLSLMADEEREQVVRAWNPPATRPADCDLLAGGLLLTALEGQAASTPDAVAIVDDDGCVTYQTLYARADRWASHLRADGVGPEVPVAVCVEPGADLIAVLLAVWKAGGAYVPLEPRAPTDRLTYIVRDVRARVLITTYALASTIVVPGLRVICIDLDGAWVSGALASPAPAVRPAITPENLAYVIYTSGSTGRPKGVAVTHGNVTSLFASSDACVACAADDVWTLFHSAAFDFSVWEMWGALRTGGRLVIVPYAIARTPESLVALLYREQVTVLNQTPSAFRGVMAVDAADAAAAIDASSRLPLRVVIFGGEGLDPRILRDWSLRYGFDRPALINMYGITETTVHVTCHRVTAMDVTGAAGSRIGQTLPSLQAYVRDGTGQPAPIGVAGELFVGGAGVARGYVGRPDLTAQRFVPDPFSLTPGRRLYRTGDRARWQPDGVLEYRGRLDDQIKLRGYRIEPGEIEAVLREHPGVRDSVVLLREDTPGERRLVAYVVAQVAAQSDRETTREWESQQIAQWERVFEENYLPPVAPAATPVDPTFNIAGWNSSETGLPIPVHEMREWVDETVADLLDGQPRRVLEIGCGTGLLLLRVAPRCESYVATDISASVLRQLQEQVDAARLTTRVTLHQQAADDLDRLTGAERFDLVILNSVVQYFPSAAYLTRVLERAAALVAPGGRIYVGDVRSLPLLPLFHQAVQRHQAPGWLSRRAFERRVERQLHQETELVLSPEFFLRLSETLASIGDVEIRPKRGAAHNELTAFRYQVVLHVGEPAVEIEAAWLDWRCDALTVDELRRIMDDVRPAALGLTGVPNVRLQQDLAFAAALAQADPDVTLDEIRAAATREANATLAAATMHPQALAAAARDAGYAMTFDWSRHRGDGAFDIILRREDLAREQGTRRRVRRLTREPGDAPAANNPLLAQAGRHLGPVLRRFAQERLPSYMVPAAFVVLDRLPVTANGKLDRRALAPPDFARPELEQAYVAPRTPLETALAQIWMDSLRVQQIGIHDNFFELGGDSIISIQLVARANRAGLPLTPKLLFEHPTIARIAAMAETWTATPAPERAGGSTAAEMAAQVDALGLDLAIEDAYPLSPMQQGMLFHTVEAPDAGVYVAQLCYALTGDIDRSALRAAWQLVVQRHPALRTAFAWDQTRTPLQMVCRDVEVPWDERDWRGVPDGDQGERLRTLLRADRSRGFDLTRPPLMRLTLIRTGVETWELIWSHHHLLLDGWSLPIVSREVLESYDALRRGATPSFAPPVPYRSYIDWLARHDEQAAERHWRRYLHRTPSLRLPFTSLASVSSSIAASSLRILVNTRRTAALKRWARTRQITLNTLLQGIWAMTLSRLSEQDDVLFGGVVSGRPPALAGSDRCVGLFINTLPVRIIVDPDARVIDWMRTVQAQQVAQREFEFVPLMRVKSWSDAPADAPLFETLLVFENYPADPMRQDHRSSGGEVRGSSYHMTETYALVLSVGPGRQIALELKYDSRRIDAAWIERVRAMLDAALDAVTRGPAVRVADVLRAMRRADDELRAAGEARGQQTMTELLGVTRRSAERRTTRRRRDEVRSRTPRQ